MIVKLKCDSHKSYIVLIMIQLFFTSIPIF